MREMVQNVRNDAARGRFKIGLKNILRLEGQIGQGASTTGNGFELANVSVQANNLTGG